ncbi:MAG: Gfo/Idh/MocA family oxidoreductase [Myxococcota bacterium]|nr:Gfo/Idh/MocA family oxidoreductase [Myxococcota bacterium]
MRQLRIGVVGAGHMGRLHAEKIAALRDEGEAVLVGGIVDLNRGRAEQLASKVGTTGHTDIRALWSDEDPDPVFGTPRVDAVIVAVPTDSHYPVVSEALEAGLDVLVEKPIAANIAEASKLLALAEAGGRVLQVGHLEWFNSALESIRGRIDNPRFVEAHRMGPFSDRATDTDIVRDLMIHDLDILQRILGEEPEQIHAVGLPVLSPTLDIANARLVYPSGCIANLTASRVSNTPQRKLRFFQRDGCVSVDFLAQSATVFRRLQLDGELPQIEVEEVQVDRVDALLSQLRAFVRVVRNRERPKVDGLGGLDALRTAVRVIGAMSPQAVMAPGNREPSTKREP